MGVENYRSHARPRLDNQDQHRDGPRTAVRLGHRDGFDSTVRKNSMTLDRNVSINPNKNSILTL